MQTPLSSDLLLFSLLLLLLGRGHALHNIRLRPRFRPLDTGPASASGTLKNFEGVQFYGEVSVGTPGQRVPALFDTGSYESWFPTMSYCQATSCNSPGFQPDASTTFQSSSAPFRVNYLSSSVVGIYGQDKVSFGQLPTKSAIDIGLVKQQVGFPSQHAFDGIIGMGPNSTFLHSVLDQAIASGQGERRMVSIYLSDKPDGGSMTIGGYDQSHIAGSSNSSIDWFDSFPTNNAWALPYWILPSSTVAFAGETVSTQKAVVVDSGTSFIIGPRDAVSEIYRLAGNVDSSGSIECWRVLSLPVLSVTIGTRRYDLKPEQYAYRGDDKWTCHLGITPFSDNTMWILGDVFMLNFLSIFSMEDPKAPSDAVRPATLTRADGPSQVRHWIGLAPVSPARNVEFPAPTWFNSLAFYRIIIIVIVLAILAVMFLIGRYVFRAIYRSFRRMGAGGAANSNNNNNIRYMGNQQQNAPFAVSNA